MRVVIQRVKKASVLTEDHTIASINQGLLVLVGVEGSDEEEDALYLARKIQAMRIFSDEDNKMNLSLHDIAGSVLSVSQFTLHAETKKGNRPSFIKAARPEKAQQLYELFNEKIAETGIDVRTGKFGAMMDVQLVNDGPVTILMDSHHK